MGEYTYYCEIHKDRYGFNKGIYTYSCGKRKEFKYLELNQFSDKIWRQGPKGGVKIVKDRQTRPRSEYVTTNEKLMREFMWVKLQAQSYIKGA